MKFFAAFALAGLLAPAALAQHQTFVVNPDASGVNMTLNTTHEVEQHTTVSFEPKTYTGAIAPSGDSTIQVTGIFTLLGAPHEITVPMLVHLDGASATAKAHFVVPYVQWGLKNPSFMVWKADNDVAIDLNLVGAISK